MMSGEIDREAMRAQSQAIYAALGVDPRIAERAAAGARAERAAAVARTGGNAATRRRPAGGAGAARRRRGPAATPGAMPRSGPRAAPGTGGAPSAARVREEGHHVRAALVMLGVSNFDYTEVVERRQEGEQVALLAAAALQAQRQAQNDRMRQQTGGVPGMNQQRWRRQRAGGGGGGGWTRWRRRWWCRRRRAVAVRAGSVRRETPCSSAKSSASRSARCAPTSCGPAHDARHRDRRGAVIAMVALGTRRQKAVKDRISSLGTTLLTVMPGSSAAWAASRRSTARS